MNFLASNPRAVIANAILPQASMKQPVGLKNHSAYRPVTARYLLREKKLWTGSIVFLACAPESIPFMGRSRCLRLSPDARVGSCVVFVSSGLETPSPSHAYPHIPCFKEKKL